MKDWDTWFGPLTARRYKVGAAQLPNIVAQLNALSAARIMTSWKRQSPARPGTYFTLQVKRRIKIYHLPSLKFPWQPRTLLPSAPALIQAMLGRGTRIPPSPPPISSASEERSGVCCNFWMGTTATRTRTEKKKKRGRQRQKTVLRSSDMWKQSKWSERHDLNEKSMPVRNGASLDLSLWIITKKAGWLVNSFNLDLVI